MSGSSPTSVFVFDYASWAAAYPSVSQYVSPEAADTYFTLAELHLDNSAYSPVRDVARRGALLGLLVSHVAMLSLPSEQGGNGNAVGRTASAARGSVSISLEMATPTERAAWYQQTQYGAQFWAATMSLRQARYVPGSVQRPRIWP